VLCAAPVLPPPSPAYAFLGAAGACEEKLELGIPSPSSPGCGWAEVVRSRGKLQLGLGWYGSSYRAC